MVQQQGESDCGVACLQSIIQYYGGYVSLEKLREWSGTKTTGTTLLGIYQAAMATGFDAQGCEADMAALLAHPSPLILHVLIEEKLEHYIVCFGTTLQNNELKFIIGDPAKGIVYLSQQQVEKIWQSKTCLTLETNAHFLPNRTISKKKREWFKKLIKEDKPILAIAVGLGIAIALLGVTMAIFSQRLIDDVLPKKAFTKLYLGCALVFIILLIKEGLSYLRRYFLLRQNKDFNNRIIDKFYSRLLQLPKAFFDTRKIGEFTARLNDTARIQKVISQLIGGTVINALVTIITIIFLFAYSRQVGLFCVIVLPFYFLLIYKFNKPIVVGQRAIMSSYAMSESNYISTLQGISAIKNHNKQPLFEHTNKTIYGNYQGNIYQLGGIQIQLSFIANAFGVLFLICIVLYCGYRVMMGGMKAGELMAVLGMASTLLPSVANLALVSIPLNEAKIAFDRMFEFTGVEPEKDKGMEIVNFNQLRLENISFRFPGRSPLLKNISFEIRKGEMIALMGENGSGKSTIGEIIARNYLPESGKILINEKEDLNNISIESWRKIISVVPQNIHIFNASVLENIAFDDVQNHPEKVVAFLQNYGFAEWIETLPQSYSTIVGEEGINLSGGQKQLIGIARALYHQPQLLILDEANAALDRNAEKFLLKLLVRLKAEMAIIFITHRLHVLKTICDKIFVIDKGLITVSGNHKELLQSENLYSLYWKDLVGNG